MCKVIAGSAVTFYDGIAERDHQVVHIIYCKPRSQNDARNVKQTSLTWTNCSVLEIAWLYGIKVIDWYPMWFLKKKNFM